jgi:hypothetical protein
MLLQPMRRDTDTYGNDHGRKAKEPGRAQIPQAQEQNDGDYHDQQPFEEGIGGHDFSSARITGLLIQGLALT